MEHHAPQAVSLSDAAPPPPAPPVDAQRTAPVIKHIDLPAPQQLEQIGVEPLVLIDLILRRVFIDQRSSVTAVGDALGLSYSVVESLVGEMRRREWLEVTSAQGRNLAFTLSERGRGAAKVVNSRCTYASVAPVGIDEYHHVARAQSPSTMIQRDQLTRAFGDLIIGEKLLDQLGPALVSDGAVFLYGPPGTGKSSIAERMIRAYNDLVFIPYALTVDNQIVKVFDPVVHRPAPEQPAGADRRYVLCERPSIITGGELLLDMLELRYDQPTGTHVAPLQLTANNGVFIIDDFGRQLVSPVALLNRWIVPLEKAVDHLTLQSGVKFEVPFVTKVAFSTNLDPEALGDEAFFRRIPNKVFVGPLQDEQFIWLLRRVANAGGLELTDGAAAAMVTVCREHGSGDLRAYLPRDFCRIITSICAFEGWAPQVTPETIERAASIYWPI